MGQADPETKPKSASVSDSKALRRALTLMMRGEQADIAALGFYIDVWHASGKNDAETRRRIMVVVGRYTQHGFQTRGALADLIEALSVPMSWEDE